MAEDADYLRPGVRWLIIFGVPDDSRNMGLPWREELSTCTIEEIIELQSSNRVWNKELRGRSGTLVNSRLAKRIMIEEYAAGRKACIEDLEECTRRWRLLMDEMTSRAYRGARHAEV